MLEPFDIVHSVLEKYRGLAEKLAGLTDKSAEIYRSHGREPKTADAIANGNVSPVTHYMRYCRLFEAGKPGAGASLNNKVHVALATEFSCDTIIEQIDLSTDILREGCDINVWLSRCNLETASRADLLEFERECSEGMEAILNAKSKARVRIKHIEMERNTATARNGKG